MADRTPLCPLALPPCCCGEARVAGIVRHLPAQLAQLPVQVVVQDEHVRDTVNAVVAVGAGNGAAVDVHEIVRLEQHHAARPVLHVVKTCIENKLANLGDLSANVAVGGPREAQLLACMGRQAGGKEHKLHACVIKHDRADAVPRVLEHARVPQPSNLLEFNFSVDSNDRADQQLHWKRRWNFGNSRACEGELDKKIDGGS